MQKRIVVVDDEKEITELLDVYLTGEGYLVEKFYEGRKALDWMENHDVDLVLLDIMLPDMDGFSICREIRKKFYFPVIMLTAKVEESDKINGIMLGADDYITKPFQPLELLARVKGQLRRAEIYNQALGQSERGNVGGGENVLMEMQYYELRGLELNAVDHTCSLYGEEIDLTPIEFSILLYLFQHMGEAVTSENLFVEVWGEKYLDCNNTVFVHIARIREKLHENARKPKFIKTVWGVGYKLM